jgi:uncharacterized protein YecE (DUF72 family)
MISWIGTSGFQYPEWKGSFYPAKLPASGMLKYYAERLTATEINYTFRSLPSAATITRWLGATPERFRFALKAPQRVTHFARLKDCREIIAAFHAAVAPLGEKMGPVLFQLPPNFSKDVEVLRTFLGELPTGLRTAWEFRHESWFADDVYAALREHGAALCLAESEDLATPTVITADFGYLRLRREDYTQKDVTRWSKFLRGDGARWREAFVFFKHEETGSGPRLAQQLIESLDA